MSLTKDQVLANIEEVKKYIQEAEQEKKEEKVVGIAIKNRWTGSIIFLSTKPTYKEAVAERLASDADLIDADLRDADLSRADLSDADLSGANLHGADLCNAKFYGRVGTKQLTKAQLPAFLGALGFVIVD